MVEDKVIIKGLKLEFLATKVDNYNNEVSYFKIMNKNVNEVFNTVNKENYTLPYFMSSNDNNYILKVKTKYMKLGELNKDMLYFCDAALKYYKMGNVQGYYVSKLS